MKDSISKKDKIPFTQVTNKIFKTTMSLQAIGLYAFMYSKPEGWNFTIKSMATQIKNGRDSITAAMNELKDNGFVTYKKNKDGTGSYHLHVEPEAKNGKSELGKNGKSHDREIPYTEKPKNGKSDPINNTDLDINIDLFSNIDLKVNKKENSFSENQTLFPIEPILKRTRGAASNVKDGIDEEIELFFEYFGQKTGIQAPRCPDVKKNYLHWKGIYSVDQIRNAIDNVYKHEYWSTRMSFQVLFRTRNTKGESVDYIGELLTIRPKANEVVINKMIHDTNMEILTGQFTDDSETFKMYD